VSERPKKKRRVTERQREAARETARRLMAEGRWGGSGPEPGKTWGQGNRKRHVRAVPRPPQLVAILEHVERERSVVSDGALRELFRRAGPLYCLVDRDEVTRLITAAYGAAIDGGNLPHRAVITRDGRIEFVARGRSRRRPNMPGEVTIELFDPRETDWTGYLDRELLDVLALLSNVRVWHSPQSQDALDFCTTLAADIAAVVEAELTSRGEALDCSPLRETPGPIDHLSRQVDGPPVSVGDFLPTSGASSRNGHRG
jgi:hypothetical protein